MRVLVVDDDRDLVDLTSYMLRREGYQVVAAFDGEQALRSWAAEPSDLVLLDIGLPNLDGFEVCRRIRDMADIPIILLTAQDQEDYKVRGLKLGADDYITKPFSHRELIARMDAVLRRSRRDPYRGPERVLRLGNVELDPVAHEVRRDGELVHLSPLEFRILHLLAMNAGRVVPHERLVRYAWGQDEGDRSLLKTHIVHLRRKLGLSAGSPGGVQAVPGVGYRLDRVGESKRP